ncbi:hypothetical protein ACQ4PT_012532 [Festuca glaucescens]
MAVAAAEKAVRCLGLGFDMTCDLRLKFCKDSGGSVVARSSGETAPVSVPGVGVVRNMPADVKCGKGDRVRFKSDALEFNKMSEVFNQRSSVEGKIPSGQFNACFDLDSGSWAQDASSTKCLAMDGYFISLFDLRLDRRQLALAGHVLDDVPAVWDPAAIASFIEKYGTHVIVGLSMGGQDVVYVRQDASSPLSPSEIRGHLDKLGDQLFTGACAVPPPNTKSKSKFKMPEAFNVFDAQVAQQRLQGITTLVSSKEGVTVIYSKRGGSTTVGSHSEWLLTVPAAPDVINVKLVPITSLLRGVAGTGFLSHAINLYLRYKPPVADLRYFLDFQHHRMWAPVLGELPLGPCSNRQGSSPALSFSLLGSKLYVSSSQVIVPMLPLTGMRLHLEGKKNNRLGIHVEHLSATPTFIAAAQRSSNRPPSWRGSGTVSDDDHRYYEPVQWRMYAHVCTAPVKYDRRWHQSDHRRAATAAAAYIVTGAQLHVKAHDSTTVLHLRLLYSEVPGYAVVQSRWTRGTARTSGKSSSFLSMPFSGSSSSSGSGSGGVKEGRQQPGPPPVVLNINSGLFVGAPPVPVGAQKLLKFVDTSQVTMGPQDSPGYWLVTGARLDVDKGKISLHVKFSLLAPAS